MLLQEIRKHFINTDLKHPSQHRTISGAHGTELDYTWAPHPSPYGTNFFFPRLGFVRPRCSPARLRCSPTELRCSFRNTMRRTEELSPKKKPPSARTKSFVPVEGGDID